QLIWHKPLLINQTEKSKNASPNYMKESIYALKRNKKGYCKGFRNVTMLLSDGTKLNLNLQKYVLPFLIRSMLHAESQRLKTSKHRLLQVIDLGKYVLQCSLVLG
ncbi:hypothetical protein PanWU01x14_073130, partial [Parasponia andersonii]